MSESEGSALIEALQLLAHERKIDEFYIIERLEDSLAKSYERILDLEYDARVTIEELTEKVPTIPHEMLCNISKRVPRIYYKDGQPVARTETII